MTGNRRLKAVLEADVVGYSRMIAQDDVTTARLLGEARKHFERALKKHGGELINQTGDAFLLTFESALDAVQAAMEVQGKLKNPPRIRKSPLRMHFRMGIDLGDVWEDQSGLLVGNAVNTATRLETLSDPGGICVSGPVYGQVCHRVALKFEDLGERSLKNLPAPVPVFKAVVYPVQPAVPEPTRRVARSSARPIPKIGKKPTEKDWGRLVHDTFSLIQRRFQQNLKRLKSRRNGVDINFQKVHDQMFHCRVYVDGKQEAQAKIWLGRMSGAREHICYSNHDVLLKGENSWNISINPARNLEAPALWATGSPLGPHHHEYDLENLSPEEATDYLWRLFILPLTPPPARR